VSYVLHITNKNYSSWSLRPWVLMRALGIPFTEVLHPYHEAGAQDFRKSAPAGKVPWLVDGETVVWDTLAIAEYLAERHPGVWPADPAARAWARCACAEMHSGFAALRSPPRHEHRRAPRRHSATAGRRQRHRPHRRTLEPGPDALGGPWLAGAAFTAADAFFAPVAYRFRTYDVKVPGAAGDYLARLLAHPALLAWEAAALAEDFREPTYDAGLAAVGTVTADFRAVPPAPTSA
jgi:glutathione S-transferase